uniref:Reverse transcriptase domain-containing protein n=1 Tax=Tanacetum cinerariifolium TaxID=118510 RepID=A0A6L2NFN6_TANCI|nr:hypothetical protein [Tanacetum cinerariifolium]
MIRDNQFDGRIRSNPYRHIADFIEISNLFQYGENQEEAVMLRTFPFSLSGEAKSWVNELDEGTITSHGQTKGTIIEIFYHGLDVPTQGILDAEGIFLYNIPNEAFKILDDKSETRMIWVMLNLSKKMRLNLFKPPFQTMPKPSSIVSNSPNVSPFLKNCTMRIPYMNSKTFADDTLSNHVGDKELKSYEGIGTGRMTRKKIEKDDNGLLKEPNKD